ncbi:MAG: hypothetical protein ACRD16_08080 [Thermoanaerobaculia bacterium]
MPFQARSLSLSAPLSRVIAFLFSSLAGGALLVLPIPGWGWTALRAFLQF